jgi:hypothetical protein
MHVASRFLFNFAASFSEGGLKRLRAYAGWYNRNGGAWFAIHPRCSGLSREFPHNRFFIIKRSHFRRLYDDWSYLDSIGNVIGRPDVYYAYGIPLYRRVGRVNWFHLSNILPLGTHGIPLAFRDRLKFAYLGRRIRRGVAMADVISAESNHSLALLDAPACSNLILSPNGGDDELAYIRGGPAACKDNIATVLGTYRYKALEESLRVFNELKSGNSELKLIVIGEPDGVPTCLLQRCDVVIRGTLEHSEVIECLRRTKFYISTTYAENASNAVSEGVFFADESYISDIGPHRELLRGSAFARVSFTGLRKPLLHVRRSDLSAAGLTTWDSVVMEVHAAANRALRTQSCADDNFQHESMNGAGHSDPAARRRVTS